MAKRGKGGLNSTVFRLLNRAKINPEARAKIAAVRRLATISPEKLLQASVPQEKIETLQVKAQGAWDNIERAVAIQAQAMEDYGDPYVYDPEGADLSAYEYGSEFYEGEEYSYPYESVAGFLDKIKAFGRKIDPTRPGSPLRKAIGSIPGIGSGVLAAADLMAEGRAGMKGSLDKIKTLKDLAKSGDPKSKKALENLKTAQDLANKIEKEAAESINPKRKIPPWFPGGTTYNRGASISSV